MEWHAVVAECEPFSSGLVVVLGEGDKGKMQGIVAVASKEECEEVCARYQDAQRQLRQDIDAGRKKRGLTDDMRLQTIYSVKPVRVEIIG